MKRPPPIASLQGLWHRSLIAWPDGSRDETSWVNWLQGPRFYIDLRQPADRPPFAGVDALRDLDITQTLWLARQEGFAGEFHFADGYFEWRREIDYQPKALYSDQGRLWFDGDVLVEEGKDIAYIEHWHRAPMENTPASSMRMIDDQDGAIAYLIRLGPLFMYARAGLRNLTPHLMLAECVEAASSPRSKQDLVDFEISQGALTPSGWIIRRSSLPWREGRTLDGEFLTISSDGFRTSDLTPDGRAITRRWRIIEMEGPPDAFATHELPLREMLK